MIFGKKPVLEEKKQIDSKEYQRLRSLLADCDARISKLETTFKLLETNQDNLRGRFNRQLKGLEPEKKKEAPKLFNTYNPFSFEDGNIIQE